MERVRRGQRKQNVPDIVGDVRLVLVEAGNHQQTALEVRGLHAVLFGRHARVPVVLPTLLELLAGGVERPFEFLKEQRELTKSLE